MTDKNVNWVTFVTKSAKECNVIEMNDHAMTWIENVMDAD